MALHPPSIHPKAFLKALSRLIEDETIIRPNDTYLGTMGSDTDSFFQDITLRFPNHVCLRAANLLQRSPNRGIRFSALLYVRRIATPGRWFLLNRLKTITLLHLKQILLFSLYSTTETDDVQMKGVLMKTVIQVALPDLRSKLWAMLGQTQDRDWSDSGVDASEPVPETSSSVSDKLAEIALFALATELVRNVRPNFYCGFIAVKIVVRVICVLPTQGDIETAGERKSAFEICYDVAKGCQVQDFRQFAS